MLTTENINCIKEYLANADAHATELSFVCGDVLVRAYRGGIHDDFHLILKQNGTLLPQNEVEALCKEIFKNTPHIFNSHKEYWRIAGEAPVIHNIKKHPERAEEIVGLLDEIFGNGYMTLEDVENYIFEPNHFGKIMIYNNSVIGIVLYRVLNEENNEEVSTYNRIFESYTTDAKVTSEKTIVIDTLLVAEKHQGQGYGKKLVETSMDDINKMKKIDSLVCISWLNSRPVHSDKIFLGFGFNEVCIIPEFWMADSIEKGYSCPICGNPCVCSAKFLFRKI